MKRTSKFNKSGHNHYPYPPPCNKNSKPSPDPETSSALSSRPLFKKCSAAWTGTYREFWLPDVGFLGDTPEQDLEPSDSVTKIKRLKMFPQSPKLKATKRSRAQSKKQISKSAPIIAKWIVETYLAILHHRVHVYNKYLQQLTDVDSPPWSAQCTADPVLLGKFRRACRLLSEQITRPHIPHELDLGTSERFLPIFEMSHWPQPRADSGIIDTYQFSCVVEVRQHTYAMAALNQAHRGDSEYSSSSSSSSYYEFGDTGGE